MAPSAGLGVTRCAMPPRAARRSATVTARGPTGPHAVDGPLPGAPVPRAASTLPKRVRKDKADAHTGRWCNCVRLKAFAIMMVLSDSEIIVAHRSRSAQGWVHFITTKGDEVTWITHGSSQVYKSWGVP